jgi:flagellar motility protein MotE (MotC chaperone)
MNIPEKKESPISEKRIAEFKEELTPAPEKKEIFEDEKLVAEQLRREIELMNVDENLKKEAEQKAQKISFLGEQEKIEHLLNLAKEKGLVFAIKTAKEMKDSYILDVLHDILAKEGYYQKFVK